MELLQKFLAYIKKENLFTKNDHLLIAVSGGADSVVLCRLCAAAGLNFSLAHCNFKLRDAESDRDEQFVKKLSEQLGVKLFVKTFDTVSQAKLNKTSIEETARNLRYDWFKQLLLESKTADNPFSFLLTAHHADDNVETVIMNFFRGTGIKGLRGILPKQQQIVRPLLFAKRKDIEEYAFKNEVEFITDSSNASNDYTRNLFRNEILPSVEKIYPEALNNVLRNIERLTAVEYLYEESIEQIKQKLVEKKGDEMHIPVLKLLKVKPLQTVIYEIIKDVGFTAMQVNEVEKLLQSDSGKYIKSDSHIILRNRKWLIISPKTISTQIKNIIIEENAGNILFDEGTLQIYPSAKPEQFVGDASTVFIDAADLTYPLMLRKWKTGDYFYPLGMTKKKKLSRFLIDIKLSLLQKEKCWVLESNKKIVWVIGYRIDERFKIISSSKQIVKLSLIR